MQWGVIARYWFVASGREFLFQLFGLSNVESMTRRIAATFKRLFLAPTFFEVEVMSCLNPFFTGRFILIVRRVVGSVFQFLQDCLVYP